jgi:hypothetical protein
MRTVYFTITNGEAPNTCGSVVTEDWLPHTNR